MDTTTRQVTLGARTFDIPMLPPVANRKVFPLCAELTDLVNKTVQAGGAFRPTEEEFAKLHDTVFIACNFADPNFERSEFDALYRPPLQDYEAFLVVRIQTGHWSVKEKGADDEPGEVQGAAA